MKLTNNIDKYVLSYFFVLYIMPDIEVFQLIMNELKSIDNEYQKLIEISKEKKDDLKTCYKIVQDISNLIQKLNNISVYSIRQKREELKETHKKKENIK